MRVTHLNTTDIRGGAARAAYRLHRGLCSIGLNSTLYVRIESSNDETVEVFRPSTEVRSTLHRLWRYGKIKLGHARYFMRDDSRYEAFSDDRTRFHTNPLTQLPAADLFHLHWITKFIEVRSFFQHTDAPVVWTLHDMNPFTGGCHYSLCCTRYDAQCGACPQLESERDDDLSRQIWNRKRSAYQAPIRNQRLHVVAPSRWLAREARKSALLGEAPVHFIPHGLDHTIFRPRPQEKVRQKLQISDSERVVLFVAESTTNQRKGVDSLVEALKLLDLEQTTFVSVGGNEPSIPETVNHVHAGYVDDDDLLTQMYSMADVFVIPSLQEAFGQTALEAMACGTPVVGFDTGGIPDMVRPGQTGWLAEVGSVSSLRRAVSEALENDDVRRGMGENCRRVVEEEYTVQRQARDYKDLYKSILDGRS